MTSVHKSRVAFHAGNTILTLAQTYSYRADAMYEAIANALDNFPADDDRKTKYISVIDDRRKREYYVRDNGDGISKVRGDEINSRICHSSHVDKEDKFGRFALALVAPLSFAEQFTITSVAKDDQTMTYHKWNWVRDEIVKQDTIIEIPVEVVPKLKYGDARSTSERQFVTWRTELKVMRYTTNRAIAKVPSIDTFIANVFDRYGTAFRERNIVLNVLFINEDNSREERSDQRPSQFSGKPLEKFQVSGKETGHIVFNLYLAPPTTKGRLGSVGIGAYKNPFRVPFKVFEKSSAGGYLSDDVVRAFSSGLFEGEIISDRIKLLKERDGFVEDEGLIALCDQMLAWYEKIGAKHVEEITTESEAKRRQQLGRKSLGEIGQMLGNPAFADWRERMKGFKFGNVGRGHAPVSKPVGKQDENAQLAEHGSTEEPAEAGTASHDRDGQEHNEQHMPFSVIGPKGERRSIVRGHSHGLQFAYAEMAGSDRVWELDYKLGILYFNIRHPLWVACEDSPRKVLQFQEMVASLALSIHFMAATDSDREYLQALYEDAVRGVSYLIANSKSFGGGRIISSDPD